MSNGFIFGTLLGLVSGAVLVETVKGARKMVDKGINMAENVIDNMSNSSCSSNIGNSLSDMSSSN